VHNRTEPWFAHQKFAPLLLVGIGLLAVVIAAAVPYRAVDFWCCFHPIARSYPTGQVELYSAANFGVFHPPWVVWMLLPFGLVSLEVGTVLIRLTSIVAIVSGVVFITRNRREFLLGLTFALFNLHTFDLIYRGQITGLNAVGAVLILLAYARRKPFLLGLGYIFMTVSIPNALPFGLVFMGFTWVQWPKQDFLKSLALPIVVLLVSFVSDGLWPLAWFENMLNRTPGVEHGTALFTTIWRMANVLNLPAVVPAGLTLIVVGVTGAVWFRVMHNYGHASPAAAVSSAMLWTVATFLITPWALSYRYVLAFGIVTPWLLRWRLDVVVLLHVLTFLPMLRPIITAGNAWIDLIYIAAMWVATMIFTLHDSQALTSTAHETALDQQNAVAA
jgi:hypothetical protein